MQKLTSFTNQYALSKTLRFELKPTSETLRHIQQKGLLKKDLELQEAYSEVKKIIDQYHKEVIIEGSLDQVHLEGLTSFADEYFSTQKNEKTLDALQTNLRKQIVQFFGDHPAFKTLFIKELIKTDLPQYLTNQADKNRVAEFYNFSTYFKGFHENRKNIYSDKAISTGIAHRIVHENLPKFLDNLKTYQQITAKYELDFSELEEQLEDLLQGEQIKNVFTVEYFNQCLNQTGIDFYNTLLGGIADEGKQKRKGINEMINLYRQQNKLKPRECPNLKPLFKQILSDRSQVSFLLDAVQDDEQLLKSIQEFHTQIQNVEIDGVQGKVIFEEYVKLFGQIAETDHSRIFIKGGAGLTDLSQKMFQEYGLVNQALEHYYQTELNPLKGKKITKNYQTALNKWLKSKNFSLELINSSLEHFKPEHDKLKDSYSAELLLDYFLGFKQGEVSLLRQVDALFEPVKALIEAKELAKDWNKKKAQTTIIKSYLDAVMSFYHFTKAFEIKDKTLEKDEGFYATYEQLDHHLGAIIPLYNQVRNYLTQKENATEKFKLNFEKGNLLDGFTESNGITQYNGYLFRRPNAIDEHDYYLGISLNTKLFSHKKGDDQPIVVSEYQRLNYYQMKTTSFYGKSYQGFFGNAYGVDSQKLVKEILKFLGGITELEDYLSTLGSDGLTPNKLLTHLKINHPNLLTELLADEGVKPEHDGLMNKLKQLFKQKYASKIPNSDYLLNTDYLLLNDLMEEIDKIASQKQFNYTALDELEFNEAIADPNKPLYLFKITNKDLSYAESYTKGLRKSRGKDNLHTLFFKQLMSADQSVYDIGSAEMFYRPKSEGLNYPEHVMKNGHHYDDAKMLKDRFSYPIIKNKRFLSDKFLFHLSIQQNYKSPSKQDINPQVREFLQHNPDIKIIGLDRGERHLLYLSLINQAGEIEQQYSLNEIVNQYKGKTYTTDYHQLLHQKEGDRKQARQNWGTIENIKELKEGYLSQVVHKISQLMVEHNAIVVMEDLNFGFKRGRQKVEKQVYQKFEKMLIDKLNFLVLKDQEPHQPAGVLNALQLTNKFESFEKMGKQCGFIFYLPAFLTSKIDPTTGFVNQLRPKYESVEKAQKYFGLFKSIHYCNENKWFEFGFDYQDFPGTTPAAKSKWTVCTTPHDRYLWNRTLGNGNGGYDPIKATQDLELLLGEYGISYGDGGNLILQIRDQSDAKFFKSLLRILSVVASVRQNNGKKGEEERDFILSPVKNKEGKFFNSLDAKPTEPCDADANGAFHIALKGLWALQQINKAEPQKLKNINLTISNAQWLDFAQEKPF